MAVGVGVGVSVGGLVGVGGAATVMALLKLLLSSSASVTCPCPSASAHRMWPPGVSVPPGSSVDRLADVPAASAPTGRIWSGVSAVVGSAFRSGKRCTWKPVPMDAVPLLATVRLRGMG